MVIKGFCDGWKDKPHQSDNVRAVKGPLGDTFGACPDCIAEIDKDLRIGVIFGVFRVMAADGKTVDAILSPLR